MCDICSSKVETGESLPSVKRRMRVVDLPIGATEDRVVGTLTIERAIREGGRALEPGLLAEANQNVLYIDEINLLPDHITDVILDAAASGWNTMEREGISVQHPSRFILVGTINPEEGELRPPAPGQDVPPHGDRHHRGPKAQGRGDKEQHRVRGRPHRVQAEASG